MKDTLTPHLDQKKDGAREEQKESFVAVDDFDYNEGNNDRNEDDEESTRKNIHYPRLLLGRPGLTNNTLDCARNALVQVMAGMPQLVRLIMSLPSSPPTLSSCDPLLAGYYERLGAAIPTPSKTFAALLEADVKAKEDVSGLLQLLLAAVLDPQGQAWAQSVNLQGLRLFYDDKTGSQRDPHEQWGAIVEKTIEASESILKRHKEKASSGGHEKGLRRFAEAVRIPLRSIIYLPPVTMEIEDDDDDEGDKSDLEEQDVKKKRGDLICRDAPL